MRWSIRVLCVLLFQAAVFAQETSWYEKSFFLLHEDHHTSGSQAVGADTSLEQVRELVSWSKPDVIQIHAKGNPGWTTYPSKIGHVPPDLAKDVLGIWRDLAREGDYAWSIYYNIGRDGEIMARHPEWNRSNRDGSEIERALCYHSGVAEGYIWPMLREIIAGYGPDGFWFDGSVFTIRSCYCEACVARFRKEHSAEPPKSPSDPLWPEFQEMHRQIYREFVAATCREIHALAPGCLITFNWINSLRMPERPDPGVAYLTGDIANRVEGLSAEAHWYDGTGVPFDLMTTGHTFIADEKTGGTLKIPKPAIQIAQEMAVIIANGGRFNLWDNPSPTSEISAEMHAMYRDVVAPFLRSRQPYCQGTTRVADVALLHNAAAHYALCEEGSLPFNRKNNRIEGATTTLSRLHLDYEMVGDWRLHAQDLAPKLLIVEHPKRLSDADVDGILKYLERGGDVLLTGMGILQDKRLLPAFGLDGVEGAKEPAAYTTHIGTRDFAFSHFVYRAIPGDAKIMVECTDTAGNARPLLTACGHGQGTAYYVSFPLLSEHGPQTTPTTLVEAMLAVVLPNEQRTVVTDLPAEVELVLRESTKNRFVHLVNMSKGTRTLGPQMQYVPVRIDTMPTIAPHTLSIRLDRKPSRLLAQPGGTSLEFTWSEGCLTMRTPAVAQHTIIEIQR